MWLRDASRARCKMHGEWGDGTLRKLRENDLAFVWHYRNRGLWRLDHEGTELSVNFSIMLSGQELLVCMYIYLYKAATSQNICHFFFFAPRGMWRLGRKRKLRGVSLCVFSKCRWCGNFFTGRNETTKTKMTINGVYLDHGHDHDRKLKLQ